MTCEPYNSDKFPVGVHQACESWLQFRTSKNMLKMTDITFRIATRLREKIILSWARLQTKRALVKWRKREIVSCLFE